MSCHDHRSVDTVPHVLFRRRTPGQSDLTYHEAMVTLQYVSSLQWSMSQMTPGAPPMKPVNSIEHVFNIGCLLSGLVIFGGVVSSMTTTLTHWMLVRKERMRLVDELDKFLVLRKVSVAAAMCARKQVKIRMAKKKPIVATEVPALSLVSSALRSEIHHEICRSHLLMHHLFRVVYRVNGQVLEAICSSAVSFKALLPHDELFQPHLRTDTAFYVVSGALRYHRSGVDTNEEITPVNERSWICWAAVWCHWMTLGKAEASDSTELLCLSAPVLFTTIGLCPNLRELFQEYASLFHERLCLAVPPRFPLPDDIQVAQTDHLDLVWARM